MEFAVMTMAGAFATVIIIVALRIDHVEWLESRRKKNGTDNKAA
jgi:hypothetical protein